MNEQFIQRIESSFQLLAPRGEELVDRFYAHLFASYPAVRGMFPKEMSGQKQKLLASIVLVVKSLRNPEQLREALLRLGGKHAGYGVQEAHYVAVRDTLIDVMREMAGKVWSKQLTDDWTAALNHVAEVMIEGQKSAATSVR